MEEYKQLHLLGVSFRNAPLAVREALAFGPAETIDLLRAAKKEMPDVEAIVLSTCNRTEFYLAAPLGTNPDEAWLQLLKKSRPKAPILQGNCSRYHLQDQAAANHLLRVATGLDSAILGDTQILGQVKKTLALAGKSGALGGWLHQISRQALRAGKRARTETDIGRGAASVGSALAGMLANRINRNGPKLKNRILIIGAGEIAGNAARHIAKQQLGELSIANRTREKAEILAEHCGGHVIDWRDLESEICRADTVISAVSSKEPVLKLPLLNRIAAERKSNPVLLIDAGVPRNIETGSPHEIWNIDSIKDQQNEVLKRRRDSVPKVEKIIAEEIENWNRWQTSRPVESLLKEVYQNAIKLSEETARELASEESLDPESAQIILRRSLGKLLHGHSRNLRKSLLLQSGAGALT